MKTRLLSLAALFLSFGMNAQTVSTFENLGLLPNSYWDGSNNLGHFNDGNAIFSNDYSSQYWSAGFAYTNKKDSTTSGYMNMYSARTAVGYNNSANYAVMEMSGKIKLSGNAAGKVVNGFYATNTTFADLSMEAGDQFAKKFGGQSGNEADWFKITISGWYNGSAIIDTVHFYLADFRFSDNSKDYILKSWEWVDLTSLGNVDSLSFSLSSTDNGLYGMNTPAYFAMDNFTTSDVAVGINEISSLEFSAYPNPVSSSLTLNLGSVQNANITIFDATGRAVLTENMNGLSKSFDVSALTSGVYFVSVSGNEFMTTKKFIKE
jgi:hypothetical protein